MERLESKIEGKPIISIVMTRDGHSSHRISAKHNKNIASFFIMRSKLYYLTANRRLFSVDLDYLTSAKDGPPATVEQEFAGNIIFDVIGNKKLRKLCWTDGQKVYVQNEILYENELNPMNYRQRLGFIGDYLIINRFHESYLSSVVLAFPSSMKVVFNTDLFSSEKPSKDNNHDTIIKFDGIYIAYIINGTQVTIHAISGHHHTVIDSLTIDAISCLDEYSYNIRSIDIDDSRHGVRFTMTTEIFNWEPY